LLESLQAALRGQRGDFESYRFYGAACCFFDSSIKYWATLANVGVS
jgi:hypothetical protein